jgi:hypothetical protein
MGSQALWLIYLLNLNVESIKFIYPLQLFIIFLLFIALYKLKVLFSFLSLEGTIPVLTTTCYKWLDLFTLGTQQN